MRKTVELPCHQEGKINKNCAAEESSKLASSQMLTSDGTETFTIKFEIKREKSLAEITAADIPPGLSAEDVAKKEY